jgi:hypothetical protein
MCSANEMSKLSAVATAQYKAKEKLKLSASSSFEPLNRLESLPLKHGKSFPMGAK